VVVSTVLRRVVLKQTNSNWEKFNMFNIIKTHQNYFTRELLHDSNVAFHYRKSLAAILGGKLFGEVFCRPSTAPVVLTVPGVSIMLTLMSFHSVYVAADCIVMPLCLSSSMKSIVAPTPSLPFTFQNISSNSITLILITAT